MKYLLSILFIFVFILNLFSQDERKFIREGNKYYNKNNFNEAEVNYRKSLSKDSTYKIGKYNLANSLYKQKNFGEAEKYYTQIAENELDKNVRSKAFHNLGNTYMQNKDFQKAVDAYKQSLKSNPTDIDTKYNLSYALQMLKQQQNKNNKNDKDKKENKKDENQQSQQNKDNQQNKDKKQQEQKQKQLKKEEAERMLEALKNDEKKTLDKVKKQKVVGVKVKTEKDW